MWWGLRRCWYKILPAVRLGVKDYSLRLWCFIFLCIDHSSNFSAISSKVLTEAQLRLGNFSSNQTTITHIIKDPPQSFSCALFMGSILALHIFFITHAYTSSLICLLQRPLWTPFLVHFWCLQVFLCVKQTPPIEANLGHPLWAQGVLFGPCLLQTPLL